MPLHAKESDYQIERDADMIVRYITTGVFRDFEQARGYIRAVYAPDANVSRGGIARALARLEKHYSGPHGSGIHDCRTKGHEDPDNSGRCIHCGKSENQEGYHFRRERKPSSHGSLMANDADIARDKKQLDYLAGTAEVLSADNERLKKLIKAQQKTIEKARLDGNELGISEDQRIALSSLVEKHREAAENPNWVTYDAPGWRVHDWRSYITEDVRASWDAMPLEAKCAIIDCCQDAADREEWD